MMINSPITEPVRASPPPPRSRVSSDSFYLFDPNIPPPHYSILMNHYPVPVIMPPLGPIQTEAIPTDGRSINDIDSINSYHHRHTASSPTNNLFAMIQHQIEYYFSRYVIIGHWHILCGFINCWNVLVLLIIVVNFVFTIITMFGCVALTNGMWCDNCYIYRDNLQTDSYLCEYMW